MSESSEPRWTYLTDMDGVLVREEHLIPGADEFLAELRSNDINFLVLTNNSIYTPRDLRARLEQTGLDVPEKSIWTSALATAKFLASQRPNGSAYVIGEAGLTTALHEVGYVLTERDPDYVVLGETRTYSFSAITRAIERATGRSPYYVGKPNPLMMRGALRALGAHSESTLMIGDRMDTDVHSGIEAGLQTILVLTGISTRESAERHPYRPTLVIDSIADLVGRTRDPFGTL
jgi:NagD protein